MCFKIHSMGELPEILAISQTIINPHKTNKEFTQF